MPQSPARKGTKTQTFTPKTAILKCESPHTASETVLRVGVHTPPLSPKFGHAPRSPPSATRQTPTGSTAGLDSVLSRLCGGCSARQSGEAMLLHKGDQPPSCHARVWTLQAVAAMHCLLHSPSYPHTSSCEPPNLMQKGFSGKRAAHKAGAPSPWARVGPLGSWREQGQRQGRAGARREGVQLSQLGNAGGHTAPQGHPSHPNKGAAGGTAAPPNQARGELLSTGDSPPPKHQAS